MGRIIDRIAGISPEERARHNARIDTELARLRARISDGRRRLADLGDLRVADPEAYAHIGRPIEDDIKFWEQSISHTEKLRD